MDPRVKRAVRVVEVHALGEARVDTGVAHERGRAGRGVEDLVQAHVVPEQRTVAVHGDVDRGGSPDRAAY